VGEVVDVGMMVREVAVVPAVEDDEEELKDVTDEELVGLDSVGEINRTEAELGDGKAL
jgi:hypothetical protein